MITALAANIYTWYIWRDICISLVAICVIICAAISGFNYWNRRR